MHGDDQSDDQSDERYLLHVCGEREWATTGETYTPESLGGVGFIHLSAPRQVHLPANRLYAGRTDLILLIIDTRRVSDEIRWEPGVPGDPAAMRFPHLYGPLPRSAVVGVRRYRTDGDGLFAPVTL
ncbi:DUF952 domain-containing protein [Gordonia sp. ABSL1-1]|uniref:DUF952 domain-containing protein n=1 Tax=Gordonia sp. ABSL1-1 TaxID=3053923 RepID=UPI0025731C64|nr:DUF952 domain-containing protein [Gordonia sp. ABSL1-1]MDL9936385.1 DUF952 domain-containing protein [Gordonia sp. ABSL1-1]